MVEFIGNVVRKTGDPAKLAVEAEKARRAAVIGQQSGLFYVPEVSSFDERRGVLETERIVGYEQLMRFAIRHDPRLPSLCARAGEALGAVHEALELAPELKTSFDLPLGGSSGENVFLHGDFNGANVGYDSRNDRLVIIDWSAAPVLPDTGTFGSRYFDLAWFACFFYLQPRPTLRWRPNACLRAAVGSYELAVGAAFDPTAFERFRRAFNPTLYGVWRRQHARRHAWMKFPLWVRRKAVWRMWESSRFLPNAVPGAAISQEQSC